VSAAGTAEGEPARILVDREMVKAAVDERLYGSFVEHMGRAIYGGIYEPGHPAADAQGWRRDVLELVRELRPPILRYPGGNFVSSYRWEDGVGPRDRRPRRLELAWRAVEPNLVGLGEFAQWAGLAGSEVMMALNLGTRGLEDAVNLVEYCNHPGGSRWSDLRRAHGAVAPYGFRLWCLGNEMDGPWQIGQKTAEEYGRLAAEVGKALKLLDPSLQLAACGSSHARMPTCPQWEATVLEHCYETVDYLSLHTYFGKVGDDLPTFLGESLEMERFIRTAAAAADFIRAKKRSRKTLLLSFDEWNVWYHSLEADKAAAPWTVGPALGEELYTLADALVVGCGLITLLRHADRVRLACLAQLVNVIAPIMTENAGPAWRQTTFYPFLHASRYGRGEVLETRVRVGSYENPRHGEVPWLEAVATRNPEASELTLFCVNRSPQPLPLEGRLGGFAGCRMSEHLVLDHPDPEAANTRQDPERVTPRHLQGTRVEGESLRSTLPPLSWNVIRIAV